MNAYFEHLQKNANTSIEVLTELPQGNFRLTDFRDEKIATETNKDTGEFREFYYCECCGGWIEGLPDFVYVNNINPMALAGRQGNSIKCRRCKYEISFNGFVS